MRVYLFSLFCCLQTAFSQQAVVDSLIRAAALQPTDSLQYQELNQNFFKYVYSQPKVAKALAEEVMARTSPTDYPYLHTQALIRKGIYYDVTSKKDSALLLYDQAFAIAAPRKDYISMGNVHNDKGLVYWKQDKLEMAMSEYVKGAEAFERVGYERGLSSIYNNMGLILYDLGRYADSRYNHLKALKIRRKTNDLYGLGASYTNLANAHTRLGNKDSVYFYHKKAIQAKLKSNDRRGLAIVYQNLGVDFRISRQLDSAIYYTDKSQKIYAELDNRIMHANSLVTLAEMYQLDGQYDKGIATVERAITLMDTTEYKRMSEIETIYARLLALDQNHRGSAAAYARALRLRDSYEETARTAQAQEYYEKYQTAQKEQEIAEQRAELAEKELAITERNRYISLLIAAAIFIILLGFFFYRQQRIRNIQRQQKNELQLALAEIETQQQLQEQRLRISRDLHDNIGSQLTFLSSSLDNLKYAQNLEPELANEKLDGLSHFTKKTMSELRDTIWAMNKSAISLEDIKDRIVTFIAPLSQNQEGMPVVHLDIEITHNPAFNAVQGMHIFRIIQEAIHNAVKYADVENIQIHLSDDQDQLTVKIWDQGKGFDPQHANSGNGLHNMKERAQQLGAQLEINTAKKVGTDITLTMPLQSH
ncbi:ATP-binding protein [Nonlabens xiamenensis]|uniref:ATP-binding protein n=1 Tax=Nonlabens xiamenensis TaxID=2341043 RepID=UPI000F60B0C1|nr:tetratricopeptide repeat-containing sensor histidine kinase [Nonlabens xiamenensis]